MCNCLVTFWVHRLPRTATSVQHAVLGFNLFNFLTRGPSIKVESVSLLNISLVIFEVLILIPAATRSVSVWGNVPWCVWAVEWIWMFSVLHLPLMIWAQGLISTSHPLTLLPKTVIAVFFSHPLSYYCFCIFILLAQHLKGFLFTYDDASLFFSY